MAAEMGLEDSSGSAQCCGDAAPTALVAGATAAYAEPRRPPRTSLKQDKQNITTLRE